VDIGEKREPKYVENLLPNAIDARGEFPTGEIFYIKYSILYEFKHKLAY